MNEKERDTRRRRAEAIRAAAERETQLAALRKIRDSEEATPAERLEAVKMIAELNR